MRRCIRILGSLLGLLCAAASDARTWYVKPDSTGDAPTIQLAIDSALAGDEILLAPGTYTRSSQGDDGEPYNETMIRMKAGVSLRGEAGPESTILDGEDQARVIACRGTGEVRIEGLTITRGRLQLDMGGGIGADQDSHPIISNCIIRNNRGTFRGVGTGIGCYAATITDCQILDNLGGQDTQGGGIACFGAAVVSRCIIRGNLSWGDPGGQGGGILSSGATITDCWIERNQASGVFGGLGGGINEEGAGTISRCTFVGNTSDAIVLGRGAGGAVYCLSGPVTISECIFIGNTASGGAAIAATSSLSDVTVTRCTVVGNHGGADGIGVIRLLGRGHVTSSIIAWNEGYTSSGAAVFSCDDLFGNTLGDEIRGIDGGENFSVDPEFCAVDPVASHSFVLQQDSPCAPGNLPGGSCGLIGAAPVGCGTVAVEKKTWSEVKTLFRRR